MPQNETAKAVTGYQYRYDRKRRVDPCTGDTGQLVEAEEESGGNRQRCVDTEKRGEADEYADRKAGRNMARVTVQRENFPETFFPDLFIEQTDSPDRDVRESSATGRFCQLMPSKNLLILHRLLDIPKIIYIIFYI